MGKANTAIWEVFKSEHCLCYSESKGLYVSNIYLAPKEDMLFLPHGFKGFWKKQVQIQKEDLTIQVETNFGYGNATYMRAIVERNGQRLLDFDQSKIYVLNNCSVTTLDVEYYDWEKLFNKIISVIKCYTDNQFSIFSKSYIEEINNLLDRKEILIIGTFNKNSTIWDGEYLVTLFAANKIRDLIEGYNIANITDDYFSEKCIQLCNKFLHKIQEIEIDLSDKRTTQLAKTLFMIHEFMKKNEKGLDFLGYFISKS